uniref:Olfactory receptor n=1 Tax=Pyxicephalus adspersus TaxID=30357 RepID=A0AAV3APG3_PYXAD|nr:TPA: hypothetical protein GDO54_005787 [Pyxicephalus adspersus]
MFEFSGLTDDKELIPFLFMFFLLVYMVSIVGNLGMITLVYSFSSLHTPMYFMLSSLSLVDLFYSSVITPQLLVHFFSTRKLISFIGCALQLYFFSALASTGNLLLSTMSYDRYVAICHPFHYTLIITKKRCFSLVFYSSTISFLQSLANTICVFSLPFCGSNFIDHFYCDIPPMLKLSCSKSFHCNIVTGFLVTAYGICTMTTIILSYTFIFLSISKMTSNESRRKAFSTCSSHIICISTFFTAVLFTYLSPHSGPFSIQEKIASVFFTIISPMLNPLIYSLRNQEVKQVLVRAMRKSCRTK